MLRWSSTMRSFAIREAGIPRYHDHRKHSRTRSYPTRRKGWSKRDQKRFVSWTSARGAGAQAARSPLASPHRQKTRAGMLSSYSHTELAGQVMGSHGLGTHRGSVRRGSILRKSVQLSPDGQIEVHGSPRRVWSTEPATSCGALPASHGPPVSFASPPSANDALAASASLHDGLPCEAGTADGVAVVVGSHAPATLTIDATKATTKVDDLGKVHLLTGEPRVSAAVPAAWKRASSPLFRQAEGVSGDAQLVLAPGVRRAAHRTARINHTSRFGQRRIDPAIVRTALPRWTPSGARLAQKTLIDRTDDLASSRIARAPGTVRVATIVERSTRRVGIVAWRISRRRRSRGCRRWRSRGLARAHKSHHR